MLTDSATAGIRRALIGIACAIAMLIACRRNALAEDPATSPKASALPESCFHPPEEFSEKFGDYRSPLLFDDGMRIESADDWPRRRAEILAAWTRQLGEWPEPVESPRVEVIDTIARDDGLRQRRVRLRTAPDLTQQGWLLLPPGDGPFPAVLVVYYEPETSIGAGKLSGRDFGLRLARLGFVTLSIGSPGGDAWHPDTGDAVCQPLSFHAYVAANCWRALAALPEIDAMRIGIVGHSYGGKWALFAAALWDRFAAVAVSDPGIVFDEARPNVNYWEPWYLGFDPALPKQREPGLPTPDNPATGAYARLRADGRDLHEVHALIAPRPLLVSGGAEDPPERWIALNHLRAVNRLLGHNKRVAMTNRPDHAPTEKSNAAIDAFFIRFLMPAQR